MVYLEMVIDVKSTINLDNNYYLKVLNNANYILKDVTDIKNLKLGAILKKEKLLLRIDFNSFDKKQYKRILRRLLFIKKVMLKSKIGIRENSRILLGYITNYNENIKDQNDFILAINAIFYRTRYERYSYIYDTVCDYLDNVFYGKNVCDFKDNKCGEKRSTSSVVGCCRHYKYKILGPLYPKWVTCEHLTEEYKCGAKCVSCKLYTCDYLRKKGIIFKIKDILLLDVFFRPLQKYYIKYMVYTPKEKVIKRLMIS